MLGLVIKNPDKLELTAFCKFLITQLKARAADTSKLNQKIVKNWNDYLTEKFKDFNTQITVVNIINQYFNNLIIQKDSTDNSYTILCNKNIKYPIINIPIDTLANMINEGVIDMARYNVFDEIYKDIKIQVPILYNLWRGR